MRAERRARRRRRRRRRRKEGRRRETDRLMRESSALSLSLLSPLSSLSAPLKPLSSASRPLPELLSCPRPQHLPLPQLPQLPQLPSCPRALFLGFVPSASSLAPDRHASLACFSPLDVLPGVLVLPALAGAAGGDGGAPGRIRGAARALPACPRQPYVAGPDESAGPERMCARGPHGCACHPTPAPVPARAPRPPPPPRPRPLPASLASRPHQWRRASGCRAPTATTRSTAATPAARTRGTTTTRACVSVAARLHKTTRCACCSTPGSKLRMPCCVSCVSRITRMKRVGGA